MSSEDDAGTTEASPADRAKLDQAYAAMTEHLETPLTAAVVGIRHAGAAVVAYEIYQSAQASHPKAVCEAYAAALTQLAEGRIAAQGKDPLDALPQWPGDLPAHELARQRVKAFLDELLELSMRHEMFIRSAITGATWLQDADSALSDLEDAELAVNLHWCNENRRYAVEQAGDPHDQTRWTIPHGHGL